VTDKQERRIDALITEVFGEGEEAELIRASIREALAPTKRVRQQQQCPKCKWLFRGEFTVRDSSFVLDTIKWLAERLAGRPGVQKDQDADRNVIFVNVTKLVDEDGEETLAWLGERGLLAKPLVEVEAAWALEHTTPPDAAAALREIQQAS